MKHLPKTPPQRVRPAADGKSGVSREHFLYLRGEKRRRIKTGLLRGMVLVAALLIWELAARLNVIDAFITSYPTEIVRTTARLFGENALFYHISVTLRETLWGFLISVAFGYVTALAMWLSPTLKSVFEPYVVTLNSLPKIALGPILIVWFGVGEKAIVAMAFLISAIVCQLTMLGGFLSVDADKVTLMKTLGASKWQMMTKLVIPGTLPPFVNMLKIALGMSWIGTIMGEYLVSSAGLGYLIVYGSQVFKLDLVMSATAVLLLLSGGMYAAICGVEKLLLSRRRS